MIRCASGVLDAIAEHARRDAPYECCGVLIGDTTRIVEARPVQNRAADRSRRYEIDPRDLLAVIKQCRGTAAGVIGAYHSHPRSSAEPSDSDRAEAFGEFIYLIAGPVMEGLPLRIEAYQFDGGNFRAIRLVPDAWEPET